MFGECFEPIDDPTTKKYIPSCHNSYPHFWPRHIS